MWNMRERSGLCHTGGTRIAAPKSRSTAKPGTLSSEEQLRLLDWPAPGESPAEFGILLCLATGMRLGEACGLRWTTSPEGRYIIYISGERCSASRCRMVRQDCPSVRAAQARQLGARDTRPPPASGPLDELRCDDSCYVLTGTDAPMEPRRFRAAVQVRAARRRCAGYQSSTPCATFATTASASAATQPTLARLLRTP